MAKNKRVKQNITPNPVKRVKSQDPVVSGAPMAWRFSGADKAGPFSWSSLSPDAKFKEVIEKLHEFETKNWSDIIKGGSHPIELDKLDKTARDRLAQIGQDDVDELMSFRLSGANRVWCIQVGNLMRVLWWDPDHKVCISLKDKKDRK